MESAFPEREREREVDLKGSQPNSPKEEEEAARRRRRWREKVAASMAPLMNDATQKSSFSGSGAFLYYPRS